jgi:CheY-like chemotaxis protein
MKKVLITKDLKNLYLEENSFLDRTDIIVFTAATNDEVLKIHKREKVTLLIMQLDMPGMQTNELFDAIKKNNTLRDVSTIIICKDTLAHREECRQYGANAVFTVPIDPALLQVKAQQLLNIAPRKDYRASLAVAVQDKFKNRPQPFWTENISASGMLIKAREPLAKGDGIFFSFFLPDGSHVTGYGEIARVEQQPAASDAFHYGIKFTDIDPSVKLAIEAVVK